MPFDPVAPPFTCMNANRKLFLSAVSSEFESCPKFLAGDLKRPTLDVAVQEDFVPKGSVLENGA